jgi:pSer/pThr/pTyr-binding forkhead associated (FHA) protein
VANLVFPQDSQHVSKRHCQLIKDAVSGRVWIEDLWSSNGTFLGGGQRLSSGGKQELRPGDRFFLGNKENLFEITSG